MSFRKAIKDEIYQYCTVHLADEQWYQTLFDFIADKNLKERLVKEFMSIRFAYKLYEGIEAKDENLLFQVRTQILSYATIYEAVIQYILYSYYSTTQSFLEMTTHIIPVRIDIPQVKKSKLQNELSHNGKDIITYHLVTKKRNEFSIRFSNKCKTAEKLGLIHSYQNDEGEQINLPQEIIEFYEHRNCIHLVAEQRKGIQYELDLSKKAYWRLQPFFAQIRARLLQDGII